MTDEMPIVLIECPHCEDGTQWASRYGGNDPDVWPVPCPHCEGTGLIEIDPADEEQANG